MGRAPLVLASLALVTAIGLDFQGVVLAPSWLVLAFARARAARGATIRDVALTLLLFVGLAVLLGTLGGSAGEGGLRYMWDVVIRGAGGSNGVGYLFSIPHLRDVLDIHLLIGPFAAFLLVLALAPGIPRARSWSRRTWFLVACSAPALLASWMLADPLQGFPRDWDLFAPFAIPFVVTGAHALSRLPGARARHVAAAIVVSLFHTLP